MKIKKIISTFLFIALILASCTPFANAMPTETVIPTVTFTSIPPTIRATETKTPTIEPSATPDFSWTPDYIPAFTDTKEIKLGDILPNIGKEISKQKLFNLELVNDESFHCDRNGAVQFNGSFTALSSADGAQSEQAVARVIMMGMFESAIHSSKGLKDLVDTTGKDEAFSQFIQRLALGEQFDIKANVLGGEDTYNFEKVTIGVPETIKLVFFNPASSRIKNVRKIENTNDVLISDGLNVSPDGKVMIIYIGLSLVYWNGYGISENVAWFIWTSFGFSYTGAPRKLLVNGMVYGDNSALVCRR